MKNITTIVVRTIGMLTIPFIAMLLIATIGYVLAQFPTPWRDASIGEPDSLSLLGTSFFAGIVFSMCAHSLAPRYKNIATICMILLGVILLSAGAVFVYDRIGNFGIVRYVVSFAGMILGGIVSWDK